MRRRLAGDNRVFVCATDPGLVITNVVRTTPGWVQYLYQNILKLLLMTPKEGKTPLYAMTLLMHCSTAYSQALAHDIRMGAFHLKTLLTLGPASQQQHI